MRVIHVGKYFPPQSGGMESYLSDLLVALEGEAVDCCALVHHSARGSRSSEERISSGSTSFTVTRAAILGTFIFAPISAVFPRLLSSLIARHKPDVLHLHMPNLSAFFALILPSARRLPWVLHWQADVVPSRHSLGLRVFHGLYRALEYMVLKHSSRIIVTSYEYLDSSAPLQSFREKCVVIPLGVSEARIFGCQVSVPCYLSDLERVSVDVVSQARAEAPGKFHVLAVGRLTYYKGFEYLIEAAAASQYLHLDIVGAGELFHKLKTKIKQLRIEDRVSIHRNVPDFDLRDFYRQADCVCLPSIERTESFGLVLLEAMAFGKPTVATLLRGSGVMSVVEDFGTGLLVPPRSAPDLARAFELLRKTPLLCSQLGQNGKSKFDKLYRIELSAPDIKSCYEEVLG